MKERFYSLDIFRGATVALMILVNNPGSWSHIYPPLEHATWHGLTPTDLVFPFFLFAVGNAMAFVLPRLEASGEGAFWQKVLRRSVLIFSIGVLLNWFPFIKWENGSITGKPWSYVNSAGQPSGVRIFGVLQRIALCYLLAALIAHYCKRKGALILGSGVLLTYWFLCIVANPADPFSLAGWFGTRIDLALVGVAHIYKGEGVPFDPEGIASIAPAVIEVVFGWLAGTYIIQKGKTAAMLNGLFIAGCLLVFAGYCWHMLFPINKKIWTSSFTVYTSGLAMLVLAVLIYLVEFKGWRGRVAQFFDVFGKNALFIFVMSGVLPRLLSLVRIHAGTSPDGTPLYLDPLSWFYEYVCKPILPFDPRIGSLIYALFFITGMWLLGWLLHRRRIYIRV